MTTLKSGDKAPDFEGVNQDGKKVGLQDFSGKKLILYFYPKDNTPGCTAESCNLNDNYNAWLEKGYEVLGVSPDSVESHRKFKEKFNLEFDLLADTEKEILQAYGAWGEKNMYGKKYMGVLRTTFVIDENGVIEDVFKKVKTKDHTNQILKSLNI
ncbi:peroxiredoxin Q/BCP [Tangfeifania diversioriginum]|uniref:thioredoxin-dependent peroxiredoxin n=1 Tax=Tangfeifania diversioriginum TaxID=1168035 RepID=A0A1M6IWC6_9BACT|nr:thioredoxin-dependent thiol peroxidase [Tangfeifania diversioriginum]SHJ38669.1 peroxiredoxin Q/BCP [Tangfeifania diversioriginum]